MTTPSEYGDAQGRRDPEAELSDLLAELVSAVESDCAAYHWGAGRRLREVAEAKSAVRAFVVAALEATHAPTEGER